MLDFGDLDNDEVFDDFADGFIEDDLGGEADDN